MGVVCALTSVIQKVCAVAPVGRHALMRRVQKANSLTIFVRNEYAMAGVVRTPYALTRVWKKYALSFVVGKKYTLTLCNRKAYALALVIQSAYAVAGRPDTICLDTHHLEENAML